MSLDVPEQTYQHAIEVLKDGGVIAYPTEAVYGLGCDPFCADACRKVLHLKQRAEEQGMIVIGATPSQLAPLLDEIPEEREKIVRASWPGPYTWLYPKSKLVPPWISGMHETIAVRIPDHIIARTLCEHFGKPLVSTSANIHDQDPAIDNLEVYATFGDAIDYIVPGRVGDRSKPSKMVDARSGEIVRTG